MEEGRKVRLWLIDGEGNGINPSKLIRFDSFGQSRRGNDVLLSKRDFCVHLSLFYSLYAFDLTVIAYVGQGNR